MNPLFFWSTTFLETEKKSKFEEPFFSLLYFSNQISKTRFLEPLFYNFLEKWLQIKWSNGETCQGVSIGHYTNLLNPQWLGFAIWLGLALVHFQKKLDVKVIQLNVQNAFRRCPIHWQLFRQIFSNNGQIRCTKLAHDARKRSRAVQIETCNLTRFKVPNERAGLIKKLNSK